MLLAESLTYIALSIVFLLICLPWVVPSLNIEGQEVTVTIILLAFLVNLIYSEFGRLFNYQKRIEIRVLISSFEKLLELALVYAAISWVSATDLKHLALVYVGIYLILLLTNLLFFRAQEFFSE